MEVLPFFTHAKTERRKDRQDLRLIMAQVACNRLPDALPGAYFKLGARPSIPGMDQRMLRRREYGWPIPGMLATQDPRYAVRNVK
jgi:hypothetical protein